MIKKADLLSMAAPIADMGRVMMRVDYISEYIQTLFHPYVPRIGTIPLKQGMTFEPTWTNLFSEFTIIGSSGESSILQLDQDYMPRAFKSVGYIGYNRPYGWWDPLRQDYMLG